MSDKNPPVIDYQLEAKMHVVNFFNNNSEKTDTYVLSIDKVYVTWFSKVLQNWKAMVSTDVPDGMYYEITHNGDKGETYIDAYKKHKNEAVTDPTLPIRSMRSDIFRAKSKFSSLHMEVLVYTGQNTMDLSAFFGDVEIKLNPETGAASWINRKNGSEHTAPIGTYVAKFSDGQFQPFSKNFFDRNMQILEVL